MSWPSLPSSSCEIPAAERGHGVSDKLCGPVAHRTEKFRILEHDPPEGAYNANGEWDSRVQDETDELPQIELPACSSLRPSRLKPVVLRRVRNGSCGGVGSATMTRFRPGSFEPERPAQMCQAQ